ncbi:MAG: tetratricopeptide repeat protein [Acidobacteriota bacterium]
MKRKEREHLKEDPFAIFIESVIEKFREYKKEILIVFGVILVIAAMLIVILLLRSGSVEKDNKTFASALEIKNSSTFSIDEKIEKLSALELKKGISSSISFFLASLYYEKGDLEKAEKTLAQFKGTNVKLVEDGKKLLDADLHLSRKENKKGLDILHKLLSDSKSEISKDFLLLKISRIHIKMGTTESAKENLTRLLSEYPQSIFQREASQLLNELN